MWFSRWIRISKGIVVEGEVYCEDIITGKMYAAKNLDNGHLWSRKHMTTRYNDDNCWPQNRSSNRFKGEADKDVFMANVKAKIGEEVFNDLEKIKNKRFINQPNVFETVAKLYKDAVQKKIVEKNVRKWW